jgi:hypothetical protein
VVAGVLEPLPPPARRALGVVLSRPAARDAVEAPAAHLRAGVAVGAVGAGQQRAVVGRDQHKAVEGRDVADGPGRQHHQRRQAHDRQPAGTRREPARARQGDRGSQQRQQQQRLRPSQRSERDHHSQHGRGARARALPQPVSGDQGNDDEQAVERLAHQRAVCGDEVRVDGRQPGRDQSRARPSDPAGEHSDGHDHARADRAAHQLVGHLARRAGQRGHREQQRP